ncbi:MAG: hypothetical protein IKF14_06815 [Atopobiaceae bacterium]|nr:hypothetical protein [Atopobiaceae bacterium]
MAVSATAHQLIIVGNGFDIECGLNSQFSSFFASRFKDIDNINDYEETAWSAAVEKAGLTAWDFILRRSSDSDWCDIEEAIKRWVVTPRTGLPVNERVHKTVGATRKYPFARHPYALSGNRLISEENDDAYVYGNVCRRIWMLIGPTKVESFGQKELFPILRSELGLLERAFEEYLRKEVASKPDYQIKSRDLFEELARDGFPSPRHGIVDTSVLTFNYTNPFTDRMVGPGLDDDNVVNIHGHLNGEIIFGIDGTDCMNDDDALPFTKTYRVVMAGNQIRQVLSHSDSAGEGAQTDYVKFYGHSLGKPDYSYFQSIFDGIELYGGRTRLVFYYRPWLVDGSLVPEEVARTGMVRKVSNLLNAYGKTLDNKDHGKNLMHRLMLEGRLEVKRI